MVVMWVPVAQERKGERWAKIFNRWKEVSGPRRRGNLVERTIFYWRKAGKVEKSKEKWNHRPIYEKMRRSGKEIEGSWIEWAKSKLRGRVKKVWWRIKLDKLKIKRIEGHRQLCRRCGEKLNSNHLTGGCRKEEAVRWCRVRGIRIEAEGWEEDRVKGPGIELLILVKFGMWRDYCEEAYGGKIVDSWKDRVEAEWQEWKALREEMENRSKK
jgi:hypothetical protein